MAVKIKLFSENNKFLSIYLIIIMLPRHYYNGVWGILENGLLLIGIFLLILHYTTEKEYKEKIKLLIDLKKSKFGKN